MNPLPRYNEKGELDTRLRVDPVTGDVGIGIPKEKKYMTKDKAVILLCEHFSEGMVRTIVDAIAKDETLQLAHEGIEIHSFDDNEYKVCAALIKALETKDEPTMWERRSDGKIGPTNAPQRTWVGLTEEDLKPICDEWRIVYGTWTHDFAREIEAKLKERNQ